MKILVTGASGFLGRAVTREAVAAGHDVKAGCRRPGRVRVEGATGVQLDVSDPSSLDAALQDVEAVIHLAGKVSRDPKDSAQMHRIHVEGTRRLLGAMDRAGVGRLILASSSGTVAVSNDPIKPMNEDHQVDFEVVGRWPYYLSKLFQEREVQKWCREQRRLAVILNPSLLLGPGDEDLSSSEDVLDILHERHPVAVQGTIAFVDVRDCAPVFVRALQASTTGQRYLLNGANMSVRRFADRVAAAGNVRAPRVVLSPSAALTSVRWLDGLAHAFGRKSPVDPVAVDMAGHHWPCDATRARRAFDFHSRDPSATIHDTVQDLVDRNLFRRPRAS